MPPTPAHPHPTYPVPTPISSLKTYVFLDPQSVPNREMGNKMLTVKIQGYLTDLQIVSQTPGNAKSELSHSHFFSLGFIILTLPN